MGEGQTQCLSAVEQLIGESDAVVLDDRCDGGVRMPNGQQYLSGLVGPGIGMFTAVHQKFVQDEYEGDGYTDRKIDIVNLLLKFDAAGAGKQILSIRRKDARKHFF